MEEIMIALADAVDKERAAKNKAYAFILEMGLYDSFREWQTR